MNPSKSPSPLSPLSLEVALLQFRTEDAWSAYDLGHALNALDSIYSTFILARHLAVLVNRRLQESAEQLGRYWEILEREGPDFDIFAHEWHRLLRRYGPAAASLVFPFGAYRGQPTEQMGHLLLPAELDYYLTHPSEYLPPTHELRIKEIAIASPGGFTLEGLGEPLRELREFIKDLCYRNRQERQKGDLEILKQKIEIIAQHNLSPQHVQVLAESAMPETEEVAGFIEDAQMVLDAPSCEPTEIHSAPQKPRRKRRPRSGKQ